MKWKQGVIYIYVYKYIVGLSQAMVDFFFLFFFFVYYALITVHHCK